nr:MAG TPA: hypothetical protein [Caudoviricetes sp.]
MPSPTVIVNHKTYSGVGRLSIPLSTGTGNGDFIYIGGDPGSLPQWQANVKIAGVKYNAVQRVTLPKQGGGEAHYLCAAGTFREFPVNPGGKKINIGDYVKLEAGLYPSESLYPSADLYPRNVILATGAGTDSANADGIAMNDAEPGGTVLVYIPKT